MLGIGGVHLCPTTVLWVWAFMGPMFWLLPVHIVAVTSSLQHLRGWRQVSFTHDLLHPRSCSISSTGTMLSCPWRCCAYIPTGILRFALQCKGILLHDIPLLQIDVAMSCAPFIPLIGGNVWKARVRSTWKGSHSRNAVSSKKRHGVGGCCSIFMSHFSQQYTLNDRKINDHLHFPASSMEDLHLWTLSVKWNKNFLFSEASIHGQHDRLCRARSNDITSIK